MTEATLTHIFKSTKPFIGVLSLDFMLANTTECHVTDFVFQHYFNEYQKGVMPLEHLPGVYQENPAIQTLKQEKDLKQKRDRDAFRQLLNIMQAECRRLEKEYCQLHDQLYEKYQGNIVNGMINNAVFFTAKEQNRLAKATEEEKVQAITKKFLDEGGEIRPAFAGTMEARFIQLQLKMEEQQQAIEQHQRMMLRSSDQANDLSTWVFK